MVFAPSFNTTALSDGSLRPSRLSTGSIGATDFGPQSSAISGGIAP